MSAQSITNAIGRITANPSKNIPVSTQIVEAVTNYLKKNNIEDPERAMAIISTIMPYYNKHERVNLVLRKQELDCKMELEGV